MAKFGLGKGLSALIPTDEPPQDWPEDGTVSAQSYGDYLPGPDAENLPADVPGASDGVEIDGSQTLAKTAEPDIVNQVTNIPVGLIDPNPYQPRRDFEPEALRELSDSIRHHGIIQPLIVTQLPDGRFELVAGERRLQAAKLVGLKVVPSVVRPKDLDGQSKLEIAIIENIQREDLNVVEQGRAFQRLHDEFGLTYDEIALKVGKSRPAVSNIVRLLQLPAEIQRALVDGKISEGHGRALLQVADREGQYALFEIIMKKRLATDQAMALGREWTARPRNLHVKSIRDREMQALQNHLRNKLGVKSIIVSRSDNGGGKILITCLTDDEFNGLMDRFNSL